MRMSELQDINSQLREKKKGRIFKKIKKLQLDFFLSVEETGFHILVYYRS